MDFTDLSNSDLLLALISANHSAIRGDLMLNAIEDAMDHADGLAVAPPWTPPTECPACHKPWHLATPTGFTNGPQFSGMSLRELQEQHSNYRHSGFDEYAARIEHECFTRGLTLP
jgi:hypothetical protein